MTDPIECDGCGNKKKTFFCASCDCNFCEECWDTQIQHRPGRRKLDGRTHVKEDRAMVERMHSILEPPQDPKTLREMHVKDQDTRWFGVMRSNPEDRSQFSRPQFHDFRRYAQLMLESRPLTGAPRYPKLISFIGDTNAGKSTIVKALVSRSVSTLSEAQTIEHQMPIPGSVEHESTATSEGVHLYADPALLGSEKPVLYADCEGLNAGERPPFAVEAIQKGDDTSPRNKLQRRLQPLIREIKWIKDGERGTREFAVGQLYPRFLYTFSDAIVFVQKNPKQLDQTYKYLVDWARFSVEEAINQPVLPHAIVVLNAVEMGSSTSRWTVDDATESFFRDVEDAVANYPELQKLAELQGINPRHKSASRQLLQCFYSQTKVIRIPYKMPERYALIDQQIGNLHDLIIEASKGAHYAKLVRRRLNDVDALQEYLQAGFDHFVSNLDQPFDFKSVSLRSKILAQDFGDHIINLAGTAQKYTRVKGKMLFSGLVSLVASCILLDYVRNNLPGSIMEYFPTHYAPLCKAALTRFCDEHVPCDFVSKRCDECRNVKSTHVKGHQNSKGKITPGNFQSSFSAESYESEWLHSLELKLEALEKEFDAERTKNQRAKSDTQSAVRLHSDALNEFFSQLNCEQVCISNSTCFGCLMAIPEIPLACGHAFCKQCISEHGDASNDIAIYMGACPLHPHETFDWEIAQKPEFAGVRILTLDGGGMRGIVELEILRAIESRINVGSTRGMAIPVQRFFDLIVGTSTGGIIALGLTVKDWRVDECISRFMKLCDTAFTPRELKDSSFEMLATLNHGSKWKTTPLRDALLNSFGTEPLFGGTASKSTKYTTKAAVVTTSQAGCQSLLVANYNREELGNFNHSIELPDDPRDNMKIWEAAAATSAAPSYFKPFECHGKTYLDGALNHNNPVYVAWRERQMIWPDVMSKQPDILISLGTGQHKAEIDAKLKRDGRSKSRVGSNDDDTTDPRIVKKYGKSYRAWQSVKNYFSVLVSKIDDILDTERVWDDFFTNIVGERWSTEDSARYVRINPDLGSEPPKLDEKEHLATLQKTVHRLPRTDPTLARTIEDVTNRLFASSFYFKGLKIVSDSQGSVMSGQILSKFDGKPVYIEQVARFLKNQCYKDFVPKFVFTQHLSHSSEKLKYDITQDFLEMLLVKNEFNQVRKDFSFGRRFDIEILQQDEPTYVCLQLRLEDSRGRVVAKDYPISGFPRKFLIEKDRSKKRLQKRRAEVEKIRKRESGLGGSSDDGVSSNGNSLRRRRRMGEGSSTTTITGKTLTEEPLYHSFSDTDYDSGGEFEKGMKDLEISD